MKTTFQKCTKSLYKKCKQETTFTVLRKFIVLAIILVAYFAFIGYQYGLQQGLYITVLTWSFFVLCTPVADAGFLIDFPLRLLFNMRMVYTEMMVWAIAILVNIIGFFWFSQLYFKTKLLTLFHHILQQPFPFWGIILVSALGTFFSIIFGDELMDVRRHKHRKKYKKHKHSYRFIVMVFIIIFTFVLYDFLLKSLGVDIPL